MATKEESVTAGKLKMYLLMIAMVIFLIFVDVWSRSSWWGSGFLSALVPAAMMAIALFVAAIALCEVWLTGYYKVWAVWHQLLMTFVIGTGVAAAAWLWIWHHELFYVVFVSTIVCDTVAQVGGRKLNEWHDALPPNHPSGLREWLSIHPHQLANVSAGKTIGGFVLGLVAASGCVLLGLATCVVWLGVPATWTLVVAIPFAAIAGDLLASWVKRGMQADDFYLLNDENGLLGSHGGLLDRIDSHLCAQIVAVVVITLS